MRLRERGRAPGESFRFVVVGDLHCGQTTAYGKDAAAYFANYVAPMIGTIDADFVVLLGDEVDQGVRSDFEGLFAALRVIPAPVLHLPGNHDVRADPTLLRYYFGIGADDYFFDHGGWRFVCLNLDHNRPGIEITPSQLSWLRSVLTSAPGPKAVMMHGVPAGIDPAWDYPMIQEGAPVSLDFHTGNTEFRNLCEELGVRVVYMGHYHAFDVRRERGTLYILSGGGGCVGIWEFSPLAPGNIYHFTVAEVDSTGIKSHTVYVPSSQFENVGGAWVLRNDGSGRSFTLDPALWESGIGQ